MRNNKRAEVQNAWMLGSFDVIVATVAFGMGINKSNVRFVFHDVMAKSLEDYLQEIGRAGRDGFLAQCSIFYQSGDLEELDWVIYDA